VAYAHHDTATPKQTHHSSREIAVSKQKLGNHEKRPDHEQERGNDSAHGDLYAVEPIEDLTYSAHQRKPRYVQAASTESARSSSIRLTSRREWSRSFSDNDIRQHECSFGERVRQVVDGVDSHGPSFRRRDLRQGEAQDENESRRRGDNPASCGVLHIVMDTDPTKFVQNFVVPSGLKLLLK